MARRMDIELTSSREDGTWTWRAAGAKEPRGVIDEKVLSATAHVGDVLRVEAEFGLDGINVTAVLPPRERSTKGPTIELEPRRAPGAGSVTSSLVERRGRRPGGRDEEGRRPRAGRPRMERGGPRRDEEPRAGASVRRPRRTEAAPTATGEGGAPARGGRPPAELRTGAPARVGRARPARLVPKTVHRDALLDTLPIEERPIAEQLAAGGLPAVRRALAEARAAARAEGRPEVAGEAIVALAEQLLPRVKEATWLDRAEAVADRLDSVALRDLRAVVTSAAPRDDASRALLARLREALEARVAKLRATWEHDIAHALEEGRVLQALRLSARTPEPTARFPASLVQPLAEAASAALGPAVSPERWLALCEAAAVSPVRRAVRPTGVPSDEDDRTRKAAAAFAGRIPALAGLLGLSMPPPPRPLSPLGAPGGAAATRPVPPPPPPDAGEPVARAAAAAPSPAEAPAESPEAAAAPDVAEAPAESPEAAAAPVAPEAAEELPEAPAPEAPAAEASAAPEAPAEEQA